MEEKSNDELQAINMDNALDDLANRMFNSKLMALRAQNPFIDIVPMPDQTIAIGLEAGKAVDINLVGAVKMIRFSSSKGSGDYFVSRRGRAQIPANGVTDTESGAFMNPEQGYYYVEEINQLSIVAAANCIVTIHCFTQL